MGRRVGEEGGPCKHCGRGLIWAGNDWMHDNHLGRCQSPDVPYGHLAEQIGEPCRADGPNPCLGAFKGIES